MQQIEDQVFELVKSGMVEEYKGQEYPKFCSPTMLVNKQDSKIKTMVGDYRKLNQRTFSHAGYLPNMESLVEQMAQNRFKTKVDMRSGFWQIELTKRAQDLTAFVTPSGRIFKWMVMPFRLKNAPAFFKN